MLLLLHEHGNSKLIQSSRIYYANAMALSIKKTLNDFVLVNIFFKNNRPIQVGGDGNCWNFDGIVTCHCTTTSGRLFQ